jgi:hypothetical protein
MTGTVLLFPKTPTMNLIYKHYITPPSKEGFFICMDIYNKISCHE